MSDYFDRKNVVAKSLICNFAVVFAVGLCTRIFIGSWIPGVLYSFICLFAANIMWCVLIFPAVLFLSMTTVGRAIRGRGTDEHKNYEFMEKASKVASSIFFIIPVLLCLILALFCTRLYIFALFLPTIGAGAVMFVLSLFKIIYPVSAFSSGDHDSGFGFGS